MARCMLVSACAGKKPAVLKLLSACPKAHGITDLDVVEALRSCCEVGFAPGFELLCDHMVTPSVRQLLDRHFGTITQACVKNAHPDMARLVVERLELEREQKNAFLATVCAAQVPNTALLSELLAAASFSAFAMSAALLAVVAKIPLNTAACEALLDHGADVNASDPRTGRSVAHILIQQHLGNGIGAFVRRGIRLDRKDASGAHCLVPAFSLGLCGLIRKLLEDPRVCRLIRPQVLGVDVLGVLLEKRHVACCAEKAIAKRGVQGGRATLAGLDRWWPNLAHFLTRSKGDLSACFAFRWRHNLFEEPRPQESRQPVVDKLLLLIPAVMEDGRTGGEAESSAPESVLLILHVLLLCGLLLPCQARFLCAEAMRHDAATSCLQLDRFPTSAAPSLVLLAARAVRAAMGPEDFVLRVPGLPLPPVLQRVLVKEENLKWESGGCDAAF